MLSVCFLLYKLLGIRFCNHIYSSLMGIPPVHMKSSFLLDSSLLLILHNIIISLVNILNEFNFPENKVPKLVSVTVFLHKVDDNESNCVSFKTSSLFIWYIHVKSFIWFYWIWFIMPSKLRSRFIKHVTITNITYVLIFIIDVAFIMKVQHKTISAVS